MSLSVEPSNTDIEVLDDQTTLTGVHELVDDQTSLTGAFSRSGRVIKHPDRLTLFTSVNKMAKPPGEQSL